MKTTEFMTFLDAYGNEVKRWADAQTLYYYCYCQPDEVDKHAHKLLARAKNFCRRHEDAELLDCEADSMAGDLLAVTCDITGGEACLCSHIEKF